MKNKENQITKVEKRDGRIVDFEEEKIRQAIFKALTATGQGDGRKSKRLSDRVVQILNRRFKKGEIPHVEQIQDIVEEVLILEGLAKTAKAYILYRDQRRRIREAVAVSEEAVDRVDRYLEKLDWEVQENANMAFSLQGLNHYVVSYVMKKYWLNKVYPPEIRQADEDGDFHIHNLDTLGPYTFFGREVVVAKINGVLNLISLCDLYEAVKEPVVCLNKKDEAFAKYPKNIFVLDRNGWVRVSRVVKKKKEREMRFIKSEQGQSIIVTDNHPFIIKEGAEKEIEAKDVREKSHLILSCNIPPLLSKENLFSKKSLYLAEELVKNGYRKFFLEGFELDDFIKNWGGSLKVQGTLSTSNNANGLNNKMKLTEDLGYLVGFFIAEGNYDSQRLVITTGEKEIIKKIQRICANLGIRCYSHQKEEKTERLSLNNSTLKVIFEKIFRIKPLSQNKNLPPEILTYNLDFARGVIAGIIDGDGSIGTSKSQIVIRVASRTMLEQMALLLQFFGIIPRTGANIKDIGKRNIFKGKEIIQNYPLYWLSFSKREGVHFPSLKYQKAAIARKHWRSEKYGWNKVLNNQVTTVADSDIYDITTTSHTFLCNSLLVHNCVGWDLYDLLLRGFGGVSGKVESRPAKHFRVALGQVVNFLYTLQGEASGAVSFSNFDTLLAPFIRYDNLNYRQVKQALQEFMFNMAIPTRVGFQTPFTNVTLDINPSPVFARQPVIIGGKPQDKTYGEFQEEMDIFNKAFYETMIEGDSKGRPFTFPIPTINITKDFNWDNPVLEPLWEATAKYGINYFANYIHSDMRPEDIRSMCLSAKEEILIRNSKKIKKFSIKEVVEKYKGEGFDQEGWATCRRKKGLEVLSLNPKTLKLEWSPVKRFLRVVDNRAVEITSEDGKMAEFSLKHPIPVYTPQGIVMKFAKDIKKGDYLLMLRKGNKDIFTKDYQNAEGLVLDEDLAKILGYFVADGNYLFENRKRYTHYGEPRGIQFSFKTGDFKNLNLIKSIIKKRLGLEGKEKQDPRYNTFYLYVYNSNLARKLYKAGFRKYGRLPQVLFASPLEVIKNFLDFYFKGDGYEKRKEIHLNDLELSRDLVFLYSLVGQPVTYKLQPKSQRIYLQHAKSKIKRRNGWMNNPILADRVPGWMGISTTKVPGLTKSRMVGFQTLEKYNAHSPESLKIKKSDIYLVRAKEIKIKKYSQPKEFYDLELEKNHLFVHSLGQVSFNCCRLRLNLTELYNRGGGGLFGSGSLTGSIGVVTINMPRIGYLSKTKKEFFERLAKVMDLAKESLEIKRKTVENFTQKGLHPYSRHYLESIYKMRGKYWANHFSTIGLVGMNEALLNFIGENIASRRGRRFTLEVLKFMRERLVKYQEETGNIYNLEQTPAESTAYRLALKDKEKYPKIITAGTKKVPYYTNSTQLPVGYTNDIFEALRLQDEIQCQYTGGSVLHLFLGERVSDTQTVKKLVRKVFENFRLPYITITPTFSICPTHGYIAGEHFYCPQCTVKQPCEVYSRIVGYLRPVSQWNFGKQQEFKERKEFKLPKV